MTIPLGKISLKKGVGMKVKDRKTFDIFSMEGYTPDEVYNELQLKCLGLENPTISFESYGYDGGFDCYIIFEREETDRERKNREKFEAKLKEQLKKQAENKEEKERKEYERLRKKYERSNS